MKQENSPLRILVLDDSADFIASLQRAFRQRLHLISATTIRAAQKHLTTDPTIDLALVDMYLNARDGAFRSSPEGVEFLVWAVQQRPDLPIVIATGYGDIEIAVTAMRLGAEDFIEKGRADPQQIEHRIRNAVERRRLRRQLGELEQRLEAYESRTLVGDSGAMEALRRSLRAAAGDGEVTVLLRGETGTGKELAARMIHAAGGRARGPLVAVDLSTLPRDTLASELFGHERGAFTGASHTHIGYLEAADRGVLFLDEIGELPQELQNRLFRFLEQRTITRVGSTKERRVDVQLIAATNQDLETLIQQGTFRRELYYRLRVFEIALPPLRERPEDIPVLCDYFLAQWRKAGRTTLQLITPDASEFLRSYNWPGNVRELRNVLESATVRARMSRATELDPSLLPLELRTAMQDEHPHSTEPKNLQEALARTELEFAARALMATAGQKGRALALLGYGDRHTMTRRLSALRDRYPNLWRRYPALAAAYGTPQNDPAR